MHIMPFEPSVCILMFLNTFHKISTVALARTVLLLGYSEYSVHVTPDLMFGSLKEKCDGLRVK